jgi:KDO2-lipid IV(A) lauroyltransferase
MKNRLLLTIAKLFALLPLPACRSLGTLIGLILYHTPNRNQRDARTNIELCFPQMPGNEREQLVRRSLIETAKTFIEMPSVWLGDPDQWLQRIEGREEGIKVMRDLLAQGKGLILAAPHLGNWEVGAHLLARAAPVTVLYRPPRKPEFEELLVRGRSAAGGKMVATDPAGVRALFKALKNGEMATILPDQEPKAGGKEAGVFAPFFGTPASTMVLIGRLAEKTGAPVLYIYMERLKRKPGYRFHTLTAPPGIHDPDPLTSATALNQGVENCVRQCPEQYQWSYRRFRSRPEGNSSRYG